jgi:catechol 2,3-dioxygenase-like lactoylglutathione lyase family enzyme
LQQRFKEGMDMFKAQSHVGLTVKDLDKSIYFYRDLLGLEIGTEPSPWFDHAALGTAVGVPGAILRQVCLKLGGTYMELLEYKAPESETDQPLLSHNIGASHIAFEVDDIVAAKAQLETEGIDFYSDINFVDEGVLAGWRWVYFSDPDGYPLELVEYSYGRPQADVDAGIANYLSNRPPNK